MPVVTLSYYNKHNMGKKDFQNFSSHWQSFDGGQPLESKVLLSCKQQLEQFAKTVALETTLSGTKLLDVFLELP